MANYKRRRTIPKIPAPKINLAAKLEPNRISEKQQVNLETMTVILQEGYQKLQISLIFPYIISYFPLFKHIVTGTRYEKGAIEAVQRFIDYHTKKQKLLKERERENNGPLEEKVVLKENLFEYLDSVDVECFDLVGYFFNNLDIIDLLQMFVESLPEDDRMLITLFNEVKDLALGNLSTTAKFKMDTESTIQSMFSYNFQLKVMKNPLQKDITRCLLTRTVEVASTNLLLEKFMKKIQLKDSVGKTYMQFERGMIFMDFLIEKDKFKKELAKLQEQLEEAKVHRDKQVKANEIKISNARQILSKNVASFVNLLAKRDRTLFQRYQQREEMKEILNIDNMLTEELEGEYLKKKSIYEDIIDAYYGEKLRKFWQKLMVRKIENWICSVWKRIAEEKAEAERLANEMPGEEDEADEN